MEITSAPQEYLQAVKTIKSAIVTSRYLAARQVNQEILRLYYSVGGFVSQNSRNKGWGMSVLEAIAGMLQKEMPGLRGFSARNIYNMRLFYEAWCNYANSQLATAKISVEESILEAFPISQLATAKLPSRENMHDYAIRQLSTAKFRGHLPHLSGTASGAAGGPAGH